jgi:hypothetical protein
VQGTQGPASTRAPRWFGGGMWGEGDVQGEGGTMEDIPLEG